MRREVNFKVLVKDLEGGNFRGKQLDLTGIEELPENLKLAMVAAFYAGRQEAMLHEVDDLLGLMKSMT